MFWRKKDKVEAPKQIAIIRAYLSASFPLVRGKVANPSVRVAVQVFVLGMADMMRQAENLTYEQFVVIYSSILSEIGLSPAMGAASFIQLVGETAQRNESVRKLVAHGAQSVRCFVAQRDTDAPTDLIEAVLFGEKNAHALLELVDT